LFGFGNSAILEYGKQLVFILSAQFRLHGTFAAVFCMIAFTSKSIGVAIDSDTLRLGGQDYRMENGD
jgi:hypothetical protein